LKASVNDSGEILEIWKAEYQIMKLMSVEIICRKWVQIAILKTRKF
jgi:hypothetical protein